MMKKIFFISFLAIILNINANEPLKVGFVYVSPIGGAGWTYQHDLGRQYIEEKFGNKISTKYIEKVNEGADSQRVIRKLASSGFDLIFATSFGFMNPTLKVAKQFPNVVFEHATGYKTAKNMGNYSPRFYEGRYLAGIVAGNAAKTNIIGYIAAFPIPEVVRGINAFALGAQSVNPDVVIKVIWTNSWYDPAKESEVAKTLIALKASVLTHHTDSVATVKVANDSGVKAIGYHSDMKKFGKEAHLGAVVHNWKKFYEDKVNAVLNNTWKSESLWYGIKQGMVDFLVTSDLEPKIANKIKQVKKGIIDGSFHPFQGPFSSRDGQVKIASGKSLSDQDLLQMKYFVKGVEGSLGN